jgi:predicted Zn-dependent protease
MKKTISFFIAVLVSANVLTAQSLQDGVKLLNYEKYKSAKDVLQKLYDGNSKDPQTIYWLGQNFIAQDDIKSAKALYEKAMNDGVNDPWIWVGSGHIQLLEGGDVNAAKQKFEQAITQTTETKGKNKGKPSAAILNAIGRANAIGHLNGVAGDNKFGDVLYGIEKLKQAETIDLTNPDIAINEGLSYRKLGGEYGGDAEKAFEEAIRRDSKNARAMYLIGKIYVTQNNKESVDTYFNNAIAADPAFPPVYLAFFEFYSDKDVNKAKDYIDNFLKYADKDPKNDFFYADYLFRAGKYNESLAKAKEIEASAGIAAIPALNILYAYNYDRLNDSVQAKSYIEKYFVAVPVSQTKLADYNLAVKILSKFPGSESAAVGYLQKAIDADTIKADRIALTTQAIDLYAKSKMFPEQLVWLKKLQDLKGVAPNEFDYYRLTSTAYNAKDYDQTMNFAKGYMDAFPDKPQGYSFYKRAAMAADPDTSKGIAMGALDLLDSLYGKDKVKNKKLIFNNLYFQLNYYVYKTKELDKALAITDKMLDLYPDAGGEENKYASDTKATIQEGINKQKNPKSANKPNGGAAPPKNK